jgi:D-alanyl-D-alanine dipeptidase
VQLFTSPQAAIRLSVREETIRRAMADGILPTQSVRSDGRIVDCIDEPTVQALAEVIQAVRSGDRKVIAWGWPSRRVSGIYFALAGDLLKIGFASNIASRMRELQTGCPVDLRLIHWQQGSRIEERALHRRFAELHARGEWFHFKGALLEHVAEQTRLRWG